MTTITSNRLIHEGAVVALIESKIEALGRRIAEGREEVVKAEAQISALRTVVQGLRWIGEVDPVTVAEAAGEFPICTEQTEFQIITLLPDAPRYVVRETTGGIARWAVIDTQHDYAVTTFLNRDDAEIAADYRNRLA